MQENLGSGPAAEARASASGLPAPHRLAWLLYQQIAALLGAVAIASLVMRFAAFDWRGLLEPLVDTWDVTVRPVLHAILHVPFLPLEWITGEPWGFGPGESDYLGTGMILFMSGYRQYYLLAAEHRGKPVRRLVIQSLFTSDFWIFLVLSMVGWPIILAVTVAELGGDLLKARWGKVGEGLLFLSPLIYFAGLALISSFVV